MPQGVDDATAVFHFGSSYTNIQTHQEVIDHKLGYCLPASVFCVLCLTRWDVHVVNGSEDYWSGIDT